MLIIFEGIDGSGKSTLADATERAIRRYVPGHSISRLARGVPQTSPLLEYTDTVIEYAANTPDWHIICDRWHWGQPVYGPQYRSDATNGSHARSGNDLGNGGFAFIEDFLAWRGALVVYVWDRPEVLRARYAERGEDYLQDADVEEVLNRYETIVECLTTLPVLPVHSSQVDDVDKFADYILDVALRTQRVAAVRYHR